MEMRSEVITWKDVEGLIGHLIPQFESVFDAMLIITRGGIVPGGILAEALGIEDILTAAVDFPAQTQREDKRLYEWPKFLQFPEVSLLSEKRILVVDDVWGSGRTMTAVVHRVSGAGGTPITCVLHFNPYRNLFGTIRPNYYAAVTNSYIVYPWEIDRRPLQI